MSVKSFVDNEIATNKVVLFGKSYCPHCKKAKEAFASIDVTPKVIELDEREDCSDIQDYLGQLTGARSVSSPSASACVVDASSYRYLVCL